MSLSSVPSLLVVGFPFISPSILASAFASKFCLSTCMFFNFFNFFSLSLPFKNHGCMDFLQRNLKRGVYPSSLFLLPLSLHFIWGFGWPLIEEPCTYMSPFKVRSCDPLILAGVFLSLWGWVKPCAASWPLWSLNDWHLPCLSSPIKKRENQKQKVTSTGQVGWMVSSKSHHSMWCLFPMDASGLLFAWDP